MQFSKIKAARCDRVIAATVWRFYAKNEQAVSTEPNSIVYGTVKITVLAVTVADSQSCISSFWSANYHFKNKKLIGPVHVK